MAYTDIDKSDDYFNTVLYTGNSSDNHTISGVGFQPDFLWIKDRGRSGFNHRLQNSVAGATESLQSNRTVSTQTNSDAVKSFNSNGFVLGNDAGNGSFNGSSTFVAWNWLAGGSASSNSNGSITSTVSANTTSGFSIVSYTGNGSAGATIGHGLGAVPKMIIVKGRDTASNWQVGHSSLGWTQSIRLNQTSASASRTISWNDTNPTSSVFSVGTDSDCNTNTDNYIAYCFAEKKGYSKFGSYTGNGTQADGTFIYTGMKPSFVMLKRTDNTGNWNIYDNKRGAETYNPVTYRSFANESNTDASSSVQSLNFLSNGFKLYSNNTDQAASGGTYIYMCFASSPFTTSTGIPTTAR